MDWGWILFALAVLAAWVLSARRSARVREGADQIRGMLAAFYRSPHEFSAFTFDQFPDLDERFYNDTGDALVALGFRHFHDLQDITVSEATGLLNCGRVMGDKDGGTRAGIFHIRVGGWKRWIAPLCGMPRDIRAVEFLTELDDARFIMTNNAAHAPAGLPFPATWAAEKHPAKIGLEELYARHIERVRDSGGVPMRILRVGEAFASYDRQWEQAAAFWQSRGAQLTQNEFIEAAGRDDSTVRDVHEEVVR